LKRQAIVEMRKKKICNQCVGESYLRDEIRTHGNRLRCSYCGRTAKAYHIEELTQRIEDAFSRHYIRTPDQPEDWEYPLLADKELEYDWDRKGTPVSSAIMDAAEIPERAANDIQQCLEYKYADYDLGTQDIETEFASSAYYEEKRATDWEWLEKWREFERSLKSEARFFSRSAEQHLSQVFDKIDEMENREGRSLIVDAGPGTAISAFYRARVFQSDEKLKQALMSPDRQLGSPPSMCAMAGRMNANGISVFYGANRPIVALAEVRPPVGSRVVVARFEIIRPIKFLDLTALSNVSTTGSIFDPAFSRDLERSTFLRRLSQMITKPVMPDDEKFEYLTTQAVADFLATTSKMQIDGILFPSVQMGGVSLNCVLFHKAAKVQEIELPEGTKINAILGQMQEEGWEVNYTVFEEVPPQNEKKGDENRQREIDYMMVETGSEQDLRNPALRIDLDSLQVHTIRLVAFRAERHKVYRHRIEKNPDF
jgi:hypothetical protein